MTSAYHAPVVALFAAAAIVTNGCSQARPSNVTAGAAKMHMQPGVTTQAEVVEIFGSPNIVTRKNGTDMWVYDKISSRQSAGALGIGVVGGEGGVGALAGGTGGSSTRSETTVMLIVYFDENDIVTDYQVNQTKF